MHQTSEPANVKAVNLPIFIFPMPAGIEIISRIPGTILAVNTAAGPYFVNHLSAFSISCSPTLTRLPNFTMAALPTFMAIK